MQLILSYRAESGGGFRSPLRLAHTAAMENGVKHVQAAVAYVSDERNPIFADYIAKGLRLEVWSRHDSTLPTSLRVMDWALRQNSNLSWNLLAKYFHAKVIWWHGYGVYIGSANLTDAAWNGNCEAGTVILESEFEEHEVREQLEIFFADLSSQATPLSKEVFEQAKQLETYSKEIEKIRREMADAFAQTDTGRILAKTSLADITKQPRKDSRFDAFLKEWNATLTILRKLEDKLSLPENRPSWVPADSAPAIQVDQFLHAYYYTKVRDGRSYPYETLCKENKANPSAAEDAVIAWWRQLAAAPNSEDTIFEEWEPLHRKMLTREKLSCMSEEEFVRVARRIHAINDHAKRRSNNSLGVEEETDENSLDIEVRRDLHCRDLYKQRNLKGWNTPKLLHYLLFGGAWDKTPERLYRCAFDRDYKIPRLGLSALGEFVGWGLPEHFPPRNDRTNKALRALGHHDVQVRAPNKSAGQ